MSFADRFEKIGYFRLDYNNMDRFDENRLHKAKELTKEWYEGEPLQKVLDTLVKVNQVCGPLVGFGLTSPTLMCFMHLKKTLSVEQAIDLIKNHENLVVKAYVFMALIEIDTSHIYDLIQFSMNFANKTIREMFFDIVTSTNLTDIFLAIGSKYLSFEEYKSIVMQVVDGGPNIKFRKVMFNIFEPEEINYTWLSSYFRETRDTGAMRLLARYQKDEDMDRIKSLVDEDLRSTLNTIIEFPDSKLWNFVAEIYSRAKSEKTYIKPGDFEVLFKAIASFISGEATNILKAEIDSLTNEFHERHKREYLFLAISYSKEHYYHQFYFEFWSKYHLINDHVFSYLWDHQRDETINLLEQKMNSSKHMAEIKDPKDYTNEYDLLYKILIEFYDEQPELIIKILKTNMFLYSGFYTHVIVEFVLEHNLETLIKPIVRNIRKQRFFPYRDWMIKPFLKDEYKSYKHYIEKLL